MEPAPTTWRAAAGTAVGLFLQHHPLCDWFRDDRFGKGRVRVCSGCAVAVPTMLLGIGTGGLLVIMLWWPALPLLAASLVGGLPQLLTYRRRMGRLARAAAKGVGGFGLGMASAAWLFLPAPWDLKAAGAAAVGLAFIGLQALRARSILRTCRACPWAMDWDRCPGFRAATPEDVAWGEPAPANVA